MNKNRVEALTDAIVAIIMTIMVLEFKAPHSYEFSAIFEELPYFFAYTVSFFYIAVAWYNQHYMFSLAHRITRKIYWINNLWIFSMSLIPLAAAWVGEYINKQGPEYFYLLIFIIWSITYVLLTRSILEELKSSGDTIAFNKVRNMPIYKYIFSYKCIVVTIVLAFLILIYPPICLVVTFLEVLFGIMFTNKDSDNIKKFIE